MFNSEHHVQAVITSDDTARKEKRAMTGRSEAQRTYLPAAGRDWTLPLYDPMVWLMGANRTRQVLIERAALQPTHTVLEIGCGTGSLLTRIKTTHPDVAVVGLDPDPKALERARSKARRAALRIQLDRGFADKMPYPDGSFDRVLSSFMFHHLSAGDKEPTLREVRRVLKPHGFFVMLDFAGFNSGRHRLLGRHLHSSHRLEDNAEDRVLALMRGAGFAVAKKVREDAVLFGQLCLNYYEASI
jgi:SAM-dependent methyltransferase